MTRLAIVAALILLIGVALFMMKGCAPAPGGTGVSPSGISGAKGTANPGVAGRTATPGESAVKLVDLTKQAGLDFIQTDCGCGMRYFVEQVASGAAVFDANGDGNLDIYFPQPKPLGDCKSKFPDPPKQRLYLGDGHGHFKLSENAFPGGDTTAYGIGAAVGDYDNDGHPDIYVAGYDRNTLYHNRGDGTFEDVTATAGVKVGGFSTGAVWFDYDGDGKLDLYVLRYCNWDLSHDVVCPGPQGPNGPRDICDPRIYTPSTNKLFHNLGNGRFKDVTASSNTGSQQRRSLSAAAVDFDGDGKLDLFVANDLTANYLLMNQGKGVFTDRSMAAAVAFGVTGQNQANMGTAIGDYNDTGRFSVLVTTFTNEPYTLYRNEGMAAFTDVSAETGIADVTRPYLGFGTGFFDSRNIGRLDLFFANGHVSPFASGGMGRMPYKENNLLMLNDGLKFVNAPNALPKDDVRVHRGAAFGDFDNDGRMDILVTAGHDRPTFLHNETTSENNWLLLKLTNKYGCATPIGTQCTATIGGKKLLRAVIGGGSYGGESDHRVHFGLGGAKQVDELEIRWMSGKKQVLKNVPANQVLAVKEQP